MPVSVRMQPLLEKELELAARRQGVTKSQFIISAVERALGRKDPGMLYHRGREEAARYSMGEGVPEDDLPGHKFPLRKTLRAGHQRQQDEYAAWLARASGVARILTLDVRDFSRYRLPDGRAFEIL